ncbi:hypothetical protein L1887_14337 [Cichorium endivia]|nr:hypothetical protein L1887_14337 [Cichorium endivia]
MVLLISIMTDLLYSLTEINYDFVVDSGLPFLGTVCRLFDLEDELLYPHKQCGGQTIIDEKTFNKQSRAGLGRAIVVEMRSTEEIDQGEIKQEESNASQVAILNNRR